MEPCAGSITAALIRIRLNSQAAFDEAWLTLKAIGNTTVRPDELARCVLRLAMDCERDPAHLYAARSRSYLGDLVARSRLRLNSFLEECAANKAKPATTAPATCRRATQT